LAMPRAAQRNIGGGLAIRSHPFGAWRWCEWKTEYLEHLAQLRRWTFRSLGGAIALRDIIRVFVRTPRPMLAVVAYLA